MLPKRKVQSLKDLFDSFPETKDLFMEPNDLSIDQSNLRIREIPILENKSPTQEKTLLSVMKTGG